MQYRKFGRLDWEVSSLGLGLDNLPTDEDAAVKIIRNAIDSGVNYIDVGAPLVFKDNQRLFRILHQGLRDGYQQKVKLAAAIPSVNINAAADFDKHLQELLNWFNEDSVDFLLLGGLNRFTWPKLEELKVLRRVDAALGAGKIKYAGFFFHDQYQFLRDIVQAYDSWSFCQFHYSYMDIDHHPGASGLTYAADKGLAVVAAKPLLGGRLTQNIPPSVKAIWEGAEPKRHPAEWGLRWVWNHPEVSTVVCDMSRVEQVKENAALADKALADSFSVAEELTISRVRDAYRELKPIPCTACRGCMPCPQGIDVPRIFEIYNDAIMYNDTKNGQLIYRVEHHNIDNCNECNSCVEKCGKKITITDWLKKARELLAAKE